MNGQDEPEGKIIDIDWNYYDTSKYLPPETLEIYRQEMPRLSFQSEFLAEFIDSDGAVFSNFKDKMVGFDLKPGLETVIGIDWGTGSGSDYTVMTIGQLYNSKACIAE